MKVLFIGDSIVEGSIGVSFTDIVAGQNPEMTLVNHGIPGDTLPGICRRLLALLVREKDFDAIVIEGGHNDILMAPWLGGGGSQGIAEQLGSILDQTLNRVKQVYRGRLILATLSCLGEERDSRENRIRDGLNQIIHGLAAKHGCRLGRGGEAFDAELEKGEGGDGLSLTIDGVHINERGAGLYAREVSRVLF